MTFYYCKSPTLFTSPMPFLPVRMSLTALVSTVLGIAKKNPVEPKTQASVRTIYVDADTIRELKAWQEVQKKMLKNCDYVLSYNGIPTSKHTLPRALEKLAELVGVHHIKIHALRYSHASLLISMGEKPLLSKERLGHEKIQTTLGIYGHLYPNTNLEVANKLTGVLQYMPATQSVADYTSNQHTAAYHKEVK